MTAYPLIDINALRNACERSRTTVRATRATYEALGYEAMSKDRSYYLSTCPYSGWMRDAWQTGAWRWMQEQRVAACIVR